MTCPSLVRDAVPADKPEIWRLFLQGFRENGMFELSSEKVEWLLNRLLWPSMIPEWDIGMRGNIGVVGPVGALEGLVVIVLGSYWYSSQKHLEELLLFVDPECRRTDHAKALISWMKQQSDMTGLPLVTGIISNTRTEAKVRLYERMLPKVGAFFLHGMKGSVHGSSEALA